MLEVTLFPLNLLNSSPFLGGALIGEMICRRQPICSAFKSLDVCIWTQ